MQFLANFFSPKDMHDSFDATLKGQISQRSCKQCSISAAHCVFVSTSHVCTVHIHTRHGNWKKWLGSIDQFRPGSRGRPGPGGVQGQRPLSGGLTQNYHLKGNWRPLLISLLILCYSSALLNVHKINLVTHIFNASGKMSIERKSPCALVKSYT